MTLSHDTPGDMEAIAVLKQKMSLKSDDQDLRFESYVNPVLHSNPKLKEWSLDIKNLFWALQTFAKSVDTCIVSESRIRYHSILSDCQLVLCKLITAHTERRYLLRYVEKFILEDRVKVIMQYCCFQE